MYAFFGLNQCIKYGVASVEKGQFLDNIAAHIHSISPMINIASISRKLYFWQFIITVFQGIFENQFLSNAIL